MKYYYIGDGWHCDYIVAQAGIFKSKIDAEKTADLINSEEERGVDAVVIPIDVHSKFIPLSKDEISDLYT